MKIPNSTPFSSEAPLSPPPPPPSSPQDNRGNLYAYGDGSGPTLTGKTVSLFYTTLCKTKDILKGSKSSSDEEGVDPWNLVSAQVLSQGGRVINSGIFNEFLHSLQCKTPFHLISTFFAPDGATINKFSYEEILEEILPEINKDSLPVVIPLIFAPNSWFPSKHMAVIMIINGQVEYFDPKGIISKNNPLGTRTLYDVLEKIRDVKDPKKKIIENRTTYQFDIHNCGVYASYYIHKRLNGLQVIGSAKTEITLEVITAFRKEMIKIAYPLSSNSSSNNEEDREVFSMDDDKDLS